MMYISSTYNVSEPILARVFTHHFPFAVVVAVAAAKNQIL